MHIAILANTSSGRGRAQHAVQVARESLVSDGHDVAVPNTRKLDAEIREFFVANVAPVLEASRGPARKP